jgi:hypothetical protein
MHPAHRAFARGAAGAIILGVGALPLAAQSGGSGRASRTRDSVFLQVVPRLPLGVPLDSLMVLAHALQQEAVYSSGWFALKAKIDSLLPAVGPRVRMFAAPSTALKGWIGINVGLVPYHELVNESGDMVRYSVYPPIVAVVPQSPAQRAGIAPGDFLVAYNGVDVVDNDVNMSRLLVPDHKLAVTVRRDGELKEYLLQVAKVSDRVRRQFELSGPGEFSIEGPGGMPKAPAGLPDGPSNVIFAQKAGGVFMINPDGFFGARISPVTVELARALKLEVGVLVNDVSDDTPAAKAGLRAGDVIVSAGGKSVATMDRFKRAVARGIPERSIELQFVRDKKTRTVTLTW